MECSVEMKIQAIDKMLELAKQLMVMQDNLGVNVYFDNGGSVSIWDVDSFFKIADEVEAQIKYNPKRSCTWYDYFEFLYKDIRITTFVDAENYHFWKERVDAIKSGEMQDV